MIIDTGKFDKEGKKILEPYHYSEAVRQFEVDLAPEIQEISSICSKVYPNQELCMVGFLTAYKKQ